MVRGVKGKLDSVTLQLVLQEQYETIYGICNHDDPRLSMLALVTMHPKERTVPYSKLRDRIKQYRLYDIGDIFKLSLSEFLDQPRDLIDVLLEEAHEQKRVQHRKEALLQNQVNSLQSKM